MRTPTPIGRPRIDAAALAAFDARAQTANERARLLALVEALGEVVPAEPNWATALLARRRLEFGVSIAPLHWCAVLDDGAPDMHTRAAELASAMLRLRDERAFYSIVPVGGDRNEALSTRAASHFIVLSGGVAYRVESPASIAHLPSGGDKAPAAATALPRAEWFALRAALFAAPDNRASLEAIEGALFSVSLEPDLSPRTVAETGRAAHALGAGNRWHDKALQVIVFGNGKAALIGSFAAGLDGVPGIELGGRIVAAARHGLLDEGAAGRALDWTLDAATRQTLDRLEAAAAVAGAPCHVHLAGEFARLKSRGVSADACFHVALFAAAQATFGRELAFEQREFVALDRYLGGSVTTLGVLTPELGAMAKALLDGAADRAQLLAASEAHRRRLVAVKEGELPLQWIAYLAERDERVRAAFDAWLAAAGGARMLDTALFFTGHGQRLALLGSGLRLLPGVRLLGRFGIRWPSPALCAHYFFGDDGLDVVWHAHEALHPHLARVAERFGAALGRVLALALS